MYWGVGALIISVMAAVLTKAATIPLPQSFAFLDTSHYLLLPSLLIIIAILLILLNQRLSLPSSDTSVNSSPKLSSISASSTARILSLLQPLRYLIVAILALALIVGSLLQALTAHQQFVFLSSYDRANNLGENHASLNLDIHHDTPLGHFSPRNSEINMVTICYPLAPAFPIGKTSSKLACGRGMT